MQQHILRTKNGGYYWFFYYDSANTKVLQPMRSSDFVTWNLGAGLGITGDTGNEGRDFSVAYADVSGHDVIHFVGSHQNNGIHGAYHFGVELSGPSIQGYAGETLVTSTTFFLSPAEPDGPAIAVGSDHNVTLATGWFNQNGLNGHNFDTVANMDVYQSTSPDTGSGNAGTPGAERLHHWVSTYVNNRALVALDSGKVLAVWPEADDASAPDSSDLSWAWSGDGWQDPTTRLVFGAVSPTATNDWAVCGVTPTVVHAVRRKVDSSANDTFDDMVFDASNGAWSPGASIPTQPGIYGTGVALVTNGSHMLLFSVASDGHNSIVYTRFDGTSWSAWQTLVGGSAKRAFLSGSGCANRDHAMITWTEGAAAPYTVMGAEVTSLL